LPNCLAVDEFHTHLGKAPHYAWSREGCPVEVIQPGQKGSRFTVIICVRSVNKQAVIDYKLIKKNREKKGTKAVDFYNFIKDIRLKLSTNETHYILLDNASIHHADKKLKSFGLLSIEELSIQEKFTLIYLPRYAPMLNPAELAINIIGYYIETNQPRTEKELRVVIEKAISFLNQHDFTKFFRRCRDYFYVVKNGK
jgi:transposase